MTTTTVFYHYTAAPPQPPPVQQPGPDRPREDMSPELLHKVMQQQQLLEMEKIREQQQVHTKA